MIHHPQGCSGQNLVEEKMGEYQEELGDEGALGEERMGGGEEGKMEDREWAWTSSEEPNISECPPGYPCHPIQHLVMEYRTD